MEPKATIEPKGNNEPCMCPPLIYIIILYKCFVKATEPIYIFQPNPIIIIYYQMKVISLHSIIIIISQYAATHIDFIIICHPSYYNYNMSPIMLFIPLRTLLIQILVNNTLLRNPKIPKAILELPK